MPNDYGKKTEISIGQIVTMEIAFSEAAMSMQVAGKIMEVQLLGSESHGAVAQLIQDGREYSFPILIGEAGIYRDEENGGYYFYPPKEGNNAA